MQLLSISFHSYKICTPSSTHYLLSTHYPNPKLKAALQAPLDHIPSSFITISWIILMKVSSPLLTEKLGGITTISLAWNWNKVKRRLLTTASLSYPITEDINLSPPVLTVFMDTNNPCASTNIPNWPQLWLQTPAHFTKLASGGSWWAQRNEEQRSTWQTWSTWVWMTHQSPNKALWEEKDKQPTKTTWSYQEGFTMCNSPEAQLMRPMPP